MPLIDPEMRKKRIARRKARRAKLLEIAKWIYEEIDDVTDEIADEVGDLFTPQPDGQDD
jgi:hypothetical protein